MTEYKDTAERAFELAGSGEYASINHIRQQLRREERTDVHTALSPPRINQQLVAILRMTMRPPPL